MSEALTPALGGLEASYTPPALSSRSSAVSSKEE